MVCLTSSNHSRHPRPLITAVRGNFWRQFQFDEGQSSNGLRFKKFIEILNDFVIPAKAGIHFHVPRIKMDPGFRRDDEKWDFKSMVMHIDAMTMPINALNVESETLPGQQCAPS